MYIRCIRIDLASAVAAAASQYNYQAIVSKRDIIIVTNDQFAYTVPVPTVRWPVDDSARGVR